MRKVSSMDWFRSLKLLIWCSSFDICELRCLYNLKLVDFLYYTYHLIVYLLANISTSIYIWNYSTKLLVIKKNVFFIIEWIKKLDIYIYNFRKNSKITTFSKMYASSEEELTLIPQSIVNRRKKFLLLHFPFFRQYSKHVCIGQRLVSPISYSAIFIILMKTF